MQKTIKNVVNKGLFLAGQASLLALVAFLALPYMASAQGAVSASTGPASVSITGADIFASVNPNGSGAFAWFEYGPGSSFTSSTNKRYISSLASDSMISFKLDSLEVGRLYSYRVVAYNAYGTAYGQVRTFTTTPTTGTQQVASPVSSPYDGGYGVAVNSSVITKSATNGDTIAPIRYKSVYKPAPKPVSNVESATQSSPIVVITPANSTVSPGQIYAYTLRIHNESSASMRNMDITVMLPAKFLYQARAGFRFVENSGVLVSRGNGVAPFSDKDFSFSVRVSDNAQNNDSLPVTAIARFTRDGGASEDATGYALASVAGVANPIPGASTASGASASAASGASSLPGQIIPWLIAAILFIAIVLVGVSLYGAYQKRKNE